MKPFNRITTLVLLALIAVLCACGGGGGGTTLAGGIGGTGKVSSGTITRFGSVFVNGIEYNIDSANCAVDDIDVTGNCQGNLGLGMVITVEGEVSGATGTATSVVFDADAEGPVTGLTTSADGLTRSFSVLGTDVTVDKAGTRFDDKLAGFSFDTLAENNVVEVSGFFDAGGTLQATYIEKKADAPVTDVTRVDLKGTVSGVSGNGGPGDSFTVTTTSQHDVLVDILPSADLSEVPGGAVSNGEYVDVRGILNSSGSVDADRIQAQDTVTGTDGDDVSIEGLVAGFSGDPGNFQVAGRTVDASGASLEPANLQLANGIRVEVEGVIQGTTLVASGLEARSGEVAAHATISGITATTMSVAVGDGNITFGVNAQTTIEDSTGGVEYPALTDFSVGNFVEVQGFDDGSGVTATQIHRDSPDNVELQGRVDSFNSGSSITILGVTFTTDAGTRYQDSSETTITSSAFYTALSQGDLVRITDNSPADGIADEVGLEN